MTIGTARKPCFDRMNCVMSNAPSSGSLNCAMNDGFGFSGAGAVSTVVWAKAVVVNAKAARAAIRLRFVGPALVAGPFSRIVRQARRRAAALQRKTQVMVHGSFGVYFAGGVCGVAGAGAAG